MDVSNVTYRNNHTKEGCGEGYQKTYASGYYATLWNKIEKPLIEKIFTELKSGGATSCLDFACGTGRITGVAENYFETVVGVDVSDEMLSVAKTHLANTTLINQDITMNAIDKKFDVITSFRFFLNAESKLSTSVLQSLHKTLKDGGTLIVNIHVNKYSFLGRTYRLRNFLRRRVIANTLDLETFTGALQNTGFMVIKTKWYGFYPRTGWMLGSFASFCLPKLEWFCNAAKIIPKHWAQNYIVICKKDKKN